MADAQATPSNGLVPSIVGHPCHIVWRDAYFDFDRAGSAGDDRDDYLVHTYGVVRAIGPKFVDIVGEELPDGDERAITHVPAVLVQHAWVLEEVRL